MFVPNKTGQKEFLVRVNAEMLTRVAGACQALESATKSNVGGTGSGRFYGSHQASAPGEFPARWSGTLQESVSTDIIMTPRNIIGTVGTDVEYSTALEYGTRKAAPRPWLRRTTLQMLSTIKSILFGGK